MASNDAWFLQVHDHQLIFQITYEVGQFHHWQKRGEEMRVCQKKQLLVAKKLEQLLSNIEVVNRRLEVVVEK